MIDETHWCAICEDQPVYPDQELCANCRAATIRAATGIEIVPCLNAFICERCENVVGNHKEDCLDYIVFKDGVKKRLISYIVIAVVALLALGYLLGWLTT